MKPELKIASDEFFYEPPTRFEEAVPFAQDVIEVCRRMPADVAFLVSERPLAVRIAEMTPDRLLSVIPAEKIHLARAITDFASFLGTEIRKDGYFLESLIEEIEKLPAFSFGGDYQFAALDDLRKKGCRFSDLPANFREARESLVGMAHTLGISLEYLLGNLDKVTLLFRLLGARAITSNLTNLFHNHQSGFFYIESGLAHAVDSSRILERAKALEEKGVFAEVFRGGSFNVRISALQAKDLDRVISDTEDDYDVESGAFRKFVDVLLSLEEARVQSAPVLELRGLLACFKFSILERDLVASPATIEEDDPLRWKQTKLGQALVCLRRKLNWLAVSIGIKAAGDFDAFREDKAVFTQIEEIRKLAGGFLITLLSGRTGEQTEGKISDLKPDEMIFDLYCLAVLEKKPFAEVLEVCIGLLQVIRDLENREPIVNLNSLISSRLAGESYVTLLGTQGVVLRNAPIVAALEKLKSLSDKVQLVVWLADERQVNIRSVGIEEFRRAIIIMGRRLQLPHSPERILGVINDKIVPEILCLPPTVIAPGEHDLGRIVELALHGVPARYPLRRPWKKINLDQLVSMGNCLEPGVRNCLGCPVNTLYGLVMKTAVSLGYEEVITYEATGCFEVYSGIWPYAGKTTPSLHGVFGGVPSEMLGGLAAKRARVRHMLKGGKAPAGGGFSKKILHLGWGGDGATFDIGFGNLSGLFSRLQKITSDELEARIHQRALYVCYDNEGYQNTGNQYSGASSPGGDTTTNPKGKTRPLGNDMRKKPIVEIVAAHGVPFSARMNIHRQEHITRIVARALEDGNRGAFLHFLQPCTTGWKFTADSLTYDLSFLSEEGGLFSPVTFEHGIPYLEVYPTPRNPGDAFLKLQARFKHLLGAFPLAHDNLQKVIDYYREEWLRNLKLTGFEGEILQADRLGYLEGEHRSSRVKN